MLDARAVELKGAVGCAVKTNFADAMQDDVLGHDAGLQFAFKTEMHRLRDLQQQLARAHDEAGVRVADARGKFVECARHAGVGIGAEKYFPRPGVALLGQGGVAHARVMRPVLPLQYAFGRIEFPRAVGIIDHIVKVRQVLFAHEIAQNVHVAIGFGIGGENVVIGHDDHLVAVPHFGLGAEFALENANRARPAHIVRHQDIGLDPDIVAGFGLLLAGGPGHNFLS